MKIYIRAHYPEFKRTSQRPRNQEREMLQEYRHAVFSDHLPGPIASMPASCQAVIDTGEGLTKY